MATAPTPVIQVNTNYFTPPETTAMIVAAGVSKSKQSYLETFTRSFLAGIFLSFGGLMLLTLGGGSSGWATDYPGLRKVAQASVFPWGLIFTVLLGAELCTANFMVMTISTMHRKTTLRHVAESWIISYLGNLAGALLFGGVFVYWSGIISANPYRAYAIASATTKATAPWYQLFLRGIGCNYLVCIAIFLATAAKDGISKIVSIYIPIWLFVAVGFEHVVANMFLIQIGMMFGTPKVSVGYYIWHSMLPVTLGNIVAGILFMGVIPWYLYLWTPAKALEAQQNISFVLNGLARSDGSDVGSHPSNREKSPV